MPRAPRILTRGVAEHMAAVLEVVDLLPLVVGRSLLPPDRRAAAAGRQQHHGIALTGHSAAGGELLVEKGHGIGVAESGLAKGVEQDLPCDLHLRQWLAPEHGSSPHFDL